MVYFERTFSKVEVTEESEVTAFLRANLDGLYVEFYSKLPLFGLDEAEIAFPLDISGMVFLFIDLFRHDHIGEVVEMDFTEEITEAQQAELAKQLSRDKEHARMVGDSSSTQHDDDVPSVAYLL